MHKPITISFTLRWLLIFLLYYSSELVLRVYFTYGDGKESDKIESLTDSLPKILTESLMAHQRSTAKREELDKALKGNNSSDIIKAYYTYAMELDTDERQTLYKEMLAKYPTDPACANAFVSLLEEHGTYNLEAMFTYIQKLDTKLQMTLLASSWRKVEKFSSATQKKYLLNLINNKYVHADLFSVYKQLQSLAFRLKMAKFDGQIGALRDKSFEALKIQIALDNKGSKGRKKKKGKKKSN